MTIFLVQEPFRWSGSCNMERDELLLSKAAQLEEKNSCFLRIYGWTESVISVGKNQLIAELDFNKLREDGVHYVRRITGGGAVWHDQNQVTYCIAAPSSSTIFGETIESSFIKIADCLVNFAQKFLVESELLEQVIKKMPVFKKSTSSSYTCFSSSGWYEILVRNKKWIGSAQKRTKYSFVQHGSILLKSSQQNLLNYYQKKDVTLHESGVDEIGLFEFISHSLRDQLMEELTFTDVSPKILRYLCESFEDVLQEKICLCDLIV